MKIRILDNTNQPLSKEQLQKLNIWNDTMSHVCATAMGRIKKEKINTLALVVEEQQK